MSVPPSNKKRAPGAAPFLLRAAAACLLALLLLAPLLLRGLSGRPRAFHAASTRGPVSEDTTRVGTAGESLVPLRAVPKHTMIFGFQLNCSAHGALSSIRHVHWQHNGSGRLEFTLARRTRCRRPHLRIRLSGAALVIASLEVARDVMHPTGNPYLVFYTLTTPGRYFLEVSFLHHLNCMLSDSVLATRLMQLAVPMSQALMMYCDLDVTSDASNVKSCAEDQQCGPLNDAYSFTQRADGTAGAALVTRAHRQGSWRWSRSRASRSTPVELPTRFQREEEAETCVTRRTEPNKTCCRSAGFPKAKVDCAFSLASLDTHDHGVRVVSAWLLPRTHRYELVYLCVCLYRISRNLMAECWTQVAAQPQEYEWVAPAAQPRQAMGAARAAGQTLCFGGASHSRIMTQYARQLVSGLAIRYVDFRFPRQCTPWLTFLGPRCALFWDFFPLDFVMGGGETREKNKEVIKTVTSPGGSATCLGTARCS